MSEISKHSTLSDLQLLSQLLEPIFYYDVFQHPLRLEEIHQYANYKQEQCIEDTADSLKQAIAAGYLFVDEGFYQLTENPISVQKRIENNQRANKYIKRAQRISKFMLYFPFVRAVFVSGSLSKNVMPQDGDIDYFIVTKPGRLWIARTLLILFKKILHTRNINEDDLQAIRNQVRQSVIDAVAFAEEGMFPDATELYDYMYSNPINFPANTTN